MSRLFDHIIHTRLEPTDILITGKHKRQSSALFEKWNWLNNLTPEEREQLAEDNRIEKEKIKDWQ